MAQAIDPIALHQAHRSGIVIGPHGFVAELLHSPSKCFSDLVERIVPTDRCEGPIPFGANPFEGGFEAFGVVNSFGIARDLGADHAIGVAIVLRTVDAGDRSRIDPLNFQRASRRTIVGTCRRNDLDGGGVQGMFQLRAHAFIQGNVLSTAQQWYRQRQQTVSALLIGGPQNACYVADLTRRLRVER